MTAGILNKRETRLPPDMPIIIPTIPPNWLKKIASIKNCVKISFFVAPIALRIPISFILSVTDTNIMFMIPIPATTRAITLTNKANSFIPLVKPENCSVNSVFVTISKSLSSSGRTLRIDLIKPITSSLVFS